MEKDLKKVDKFIYNNLNGYNIEPSEKVWLDIEENFFRKYAVKSWFFKKAWPFITLIAIGTASLLLVLFTGNDDQPVYEPQGNPDFKEVTISSSEIVSSNPKNNDSHKNGFSGSLDKKTTLTEATSNLQSEINRNNDLNNIIAKRKMDLVNPVYLPLIQKNLYIDNDIKPTDVEPRENTTSPKFDFTVKNDYARKANMFFGCHFTPAITYYPSKANSNNYTIEITADYVPSRFSLQSGIGLSYYDETGDYLVNYESFDSVGYYLNVISFSINPGNPDSIIFNLKEQNIYDTVKHYTISETKNKYLYIQIPFSAGYTLFNYKRLSCTLRAGVIFSVMVYKNEPEINYTATDINLINIEKQYPGRLSTNWQFSAGISFSYTLNHKIRFAIEPIYKYYLNPVYEKGADYSTKNPFSIGLRTGIYFNL